jgi:hypothetical protein
MCLRCGGDDEEEGLGRWARVQCVLAEARDRIEDLRDSVEEALAEHPQVTDWAHDQGDRLVGALRRRASRQRSRLGRAALSWAQDRLESRGWGWGDPEWDLEWDMVLPEPEPEHAPVLVPARRAVRAPARPAALPLPPETLDPLMQAPQIRERIEAARRRR